MPICNCGRKHQPGERICTEDDPAALKVTIQQLESRIALMEEKHRVDIQREAEGDKPVDPRPGNGMCAYAGPGRGDCESFVGLPGRSIPRQHDGDDDTVDVYGKPNGWCWHCWLMYQRGQLQTQLREANESVEQLRVQLAGCSVAALGGVSEGQLVERGSYGWSASYEDVFHLRLNYEQLLKEKTPEPEPELKRGPSRWERLNK